MANRFVAGLASQASAEAEGSFDDARAPEAALHGEASHLAMRTVYKG